MKNLLHTLHTPQRSAMPRGATPGRLLLLVALLAAAPLAAPAASLDYRVTAASQAGVLSPDSASGVLPFTATSTFFESASIGGAQASAGYNAGVVRVSANANWVAGGNQTAANARILIVDSFTLSAPLGSTAFGANLSFSAGLSGSLAASNGAALWSMSGELSSLAFRDPVLGTVEPRINVAASGRRNSIAPIDVGTTLPVTLNSAVIFPGRTTFFPYGVPIELRWTVQAAIDTAFAGGSGLAGSASADLSDTAIWLGITARDNQGAIIEGLRITSTSGQNWLEPATVVPLPATAWLLLTGVGALGMRAWQRGARNR